MSDPIVAHDIFGDPITASDQATNQIQELRSRLGDISGNIDMGPDNIRRYHKELYHDIQKCHDLRLALSAYFEEIGSPMDLTKLELHLIDQEITVDNSLREETS